MMWLTPSAASMFNGSIGVLFEVFGLQGEVAQRDADTCRWEPNRVRDKSGDQSRLTVVDLIRE